MLNTPILVELVKIFWLVLIEHKCLDTNIFNKFRFLFPTSFVENTRQSLGYACVFRRANRKNNSEIYAKLIYVQALT